jgi:CRP-like cAMP-binding protein
MPVNQKSSFVIRNKVLLSAPKTVLDKLLPELEVVSLPLGKVLFKAGEDVDSAWFVNSGLISVIAASSTGNSIEVGAIGREGVLPIEVLSDSPVSAHRYIAQIPGEALKISRAALVELYFSNDLIFSKNSLRLFQQLHNQSSQLVLCNRFHTVQQRLCRWLLMTSDWAENDQFPVTHEFLALILGVNRSTVSLELGALKASGLISNRQRMIRITDRRKIATMSCECYWTHKRDMDAYTKSLHFPAAGGGSGAGRGRARPARSL